MTENQKLREVLRFTKKPVTIEAVQFTEALRDAILFDGEPCPAGVKRGATTLHLPTRKVWRAEFFIPTLEGAMNVSVGDWIIKGVKGEYYPCKPDIFAATYEPEALALPTADHIPDAGEMVKTAVPVGERLTLSAEDVHAAFVKHFPKTRISQAWIGFAAEIAEAVAARAALSSGDAVDAQRLDFIEKSARCDPKMDGQHVWWPTSLNKALKGPTLRAAIDAAMRKDKP